MDTTYTCPSATYAKYTFEDIIGNSLELKNVISEAKEISNTNCSILIQGKSGCGKELLAQAIHNSSSRKSNAFIAVNCGAIPKNLIESELFGYESGSFTGANTYGCKGKFELANGGTIFLDEIGEMPLDMQVILLRAIQERVITKIGGKSPIPIDVRIISATNKDLKAEIRNGTFREDLYYRLAVFPLTLPELKDRTGDIPILLDNFLKKKSTLFNKPIPNLSNELFKKVISYCWPGNIRELENFAENLVILQGNSSLKIDLAECHCLTHDNLGNLIIPASDNNPVNNEIDIIPLHLLEQREIKKALVVCNGNISQAAIKLAISRTALYNKMKRYSITYE